MESDPTPTAAGPAPSPERAPPRVRVAPIVLGLLALTLGVPLLLRAFVLEAFKIPAGSMSPTLRVGDHVFVWKLGGAPEKGEVVVFPFPEEPSKDFIKRVVGVAGETLTFVAGRPAIGGVLVPRCEVGPYDDRGFRGTLYVEFLGEPHAVLYASPERRCTSPHDCDGGSCALGLCGEERGPFTVAAGEIFVVGDNRDNSFDSRLWDDGRGGGVHASAVKGKGSRVFLRNGSLGWAAVSGVPDDLPPMLRDGIARCLASAPR